MKSINYDVREQLGLLLVDLLRERQISTDDIVQKSDISLKALARMAQGKLVGWKQYKRLCKFLGCKVKVHLIKTDVFIS